MTTIECSDARWPLAEVRFHGNLDDADFDRYLDFLDRAHHRGERWLLLLDASAVRGVKAQHRSKMAKFLHEREQLARAYCMGTAFVITSPLVRGTITALFWLQKQPTPYTIVGNRQQALSWLDRQGRQLLGEQRPELRSYA